MKVLAVIPARYGSTRFPGKPLAPLWGKPMIRHVWERARSIPAVDAVIVATDDERIAAAARAFGADVMMTSADHASGTDRVAEVARARSEAEIVVNLQGDEPELDAAAVQSMVECLRDEPDTPMATLAHPENGEGFLRSPDLVKVWVDEDGFAAYFSRSGSAGGGVQGPPLRHIGVYGFRRAFLLDFAAWPPGEAEQRERLEQLRALERGVRIRVIRTERAFAGIDTPEQLEALERRGPNQQD